MPTPNTAAVLDRLIPILTEIRDRVLELEGRYAEEIAAADAAYQASARNLVHYLAVRQREPRELERCLAPLGLASLAGCEAHALASVDAVLAALRRLARRQLGRPPGWSPPIDHRGAAALRSAHTQMLLGPPPPGRAVRLMVTLPPEAADDGTLVEDLLTAGMNVLRISCARGDAEAWRRTVAHLRRAQGKLDRPCQVYAALAGPRLRTGALPAELTVRRICVRRDPHGQLLRPTRVLLVRPGVTPPSIEVDAVLPLEKKLVSKARDGDVVEIRDCRGRNRRLRVIATPRGTLLAELKRNLWVEEGADAKLRRKGDVVLKGRVGPLERYPLPIVLRPGDTLVLTRDPSEGCDASRDEDGDVVSPARIACTRPEVFDAVRPAERLWLDDGQVGGVVVANDGGEIRVRISHAPASGFELRGDRSLHLPDSELGLPALTAEDLDALSFAAEAADVVGVSSVQRPEDVRALQEEVERLGAEGLGIVLEVGRRPAVGNLPGILLAGLRSAPVGVMVARSDLAVELGFERLAEAEREIFELCAAAHVPVVWSSRPLEDGVGRKLPARAEVAEVSVGGRAECIALGEDPAAVEHVRFLSDLLARVQADPAKGRPIWKLPRREAEACASAGPRADT